MKRFRLLTLLGLLITAVTGAWADDETVTYALKTSESFTSGQTVEVKNAANDVVATITYSETGGPNFKTPKNDNHVEGFSAYTEGNGENGNQTGGTFYTITPTVNATITVAVVLNASKPFYILEDGTALTNYNGITVTEKYYGTYEFEATANKAYKIYCNDSKLGFYGFTMTNMTAPASDPWTDIIVNGDMEGTDLQCFFVKENALGSGNIYYAKIRDGIGVDDSRAIAVLSTGNEVDTWDTQFFVRLPYELPAGTPYKVSFDYKADNAGACDLQCQNEPSEYIMWYLFGKNNDSYTPACNFTTSWQTYESGEMTVPTQCDGQQTTQEGGNWLNNFQTISFSLAKNETATRYIIDNVKVEIPASVLSGLTQSPITKEIAQYPTFTLTLSPAPVTKATVTIDDQAATPDENGKIADVEANSSVKLNANDGYMFKKVKVKKTPKE